MELTNISHVRNLGSMLTLAVENPDEAAGKIFNCLSDRAVTLDGLAMMCAAAAGTTTEIVHYNPAAARVDAKKAFSLCISLCPRLGATAPPLTIYHFLCSSLLRPPCARNTHSAATSSTPSFQSRELQSRWRHKNEKDKGGEGQQARATRMRPHCYAPGAATSGVSSGAISGGSDGNYRPGGSRDDGIYSSMTVY